MREKVQASGYEWYQMGGRGHHLVMFDITEDMRDKPVEELKFSCRFGTWTPTHGSIENWDAVRVSEEQVGLLIPRAWWNVRQALRHKRKKVESFYLAVD